MRNLFVECDHPFTHLQAIAEKHGICAYGLSRHGGGVLDHEEIVEEVEACRACIGHLFVNGMNSLDLQDRIIRASGREICHGAVLIAAVDAGMKIRATGENGAARLTAPRALRRAAA